MRLAPFAVEADVDEALRLFQVSTLDAAMSGSLAGMLNCLEILQLPKKMKRFVTSLLQVRSTSSK